MSAADTPSSAQGSPFWRFSLRFYRQPKVADACIALQEEAGVDVNLLRGCRKGDQRRQHESQGSGNQ